MSFHLRARTVLTLAAVLLVGAAGARADSHGEIVVEEEMDSLVSTEWLSENLDDPGLVVLDCTVSMVPDSTAVIGFRSVCGRPAYEKGHIPTAGFADLMGDLADTSSSLQFAMPTAKQFCAAMGGLGVGDDSRVVLYDELNSAWAARVWWMLRWVGFDQAALLDGGLGAWKAEGRPLSTEAVERDSLVLSGFERPELIAYYEDALDAMEDDSVTLLDVMPEAHYRGQMVMYDRPGHIPGAVNVPVTSLLDETGHFRSDEELAALFAGGHEDHFITYCGGGIAASATAFVMTRLGFENVAVYMGSLQEWAANPENPLVTEEP